MKYVIISCCHILTKIVLFQQNMVDKLQNYKKYTMQTTEIRTLYTLKDSANQHLRNRQYSSAFVYFEDILNKFSTAIQKVQTEQQMEKVIKQIKLPSHKNLSLCYLKLNEHKACIRQCQEALAIEPNCLKVLYRIGKAYMALDEIDQAEKFFMRGFAIDPHEAEILKALQQIQSSRNSKISKSESLISLRKLVALILYWPLLIFNFFLQKIFGKPKQTVLEKES